MSRSRATSSDTSPFTNVRVMSAQQVLASSRGHRSISIGRSAGSGPEPGSWPPPDQSEGTMMCGGGGGPACATGGRVRPRGLAYFRPGGAYRVSHGLGGQLLAVVMEAAIAALGPADQLLAGAHAR